MTDKDFEIKNQWLLKYTGKNKSVVIPDGIIVIGRNAFSNKKLEEVYIPDTVRKIDMFAFENCNKLEKIRMSQNIDVIRSSAFRNCISLEEIQLPDKDILLEAGAFCGCVKLIKSPLSEKIVIGGNPFSGCKKLADENGWLIIKDVLYEWFGDAEDVVIPMGVKKIAGTFAANKNIKKLTIPGTVKQISGAVFSDCTNLQEVMMDEGIVHIDYNAFFGCSKLKDIKIPESLEKSDYKVFANCPGLVNEQKLIVIDGVLYNYLGRAKKLRIPEGITTISENAFDMRQKRGVDNLETVELPDGLTSIGKYAFRDCKKLKNINFPESLVEIEASAFFGCNELCWKRLSNADGFVIINDQLIKYVGQEKIVHVPVGVKKILSHAFEEIKKIVEVWLPESIEEIQESAFYDCVNLEEVHMPINMKKIERSVFCCCEKLMKKFTDADGFVIINDELVKYIGNEKIVQIPMGLKRIGHSAFSGNKTMKKIVIPEGVEYIGKKAFSWCENLVEVVLPKSIKKIDWEAFEHNKELSKIEIQEPVDIRERAFRGCKGLADKDGFVIVCNILFDYFGRKKKITIPSSVKIIDQVYTDNTCVLDIEIPDSVECIRKYPGAYFDSNLIKITLPKRLISSADWNGVLLSGSSNKSTELSNDVDEIFEDNPFTSIWRCYDPYIKGKKEDVESILEKLDLNPAELKNYQVNGEMASVGLVTKNAESTLFSSDCIIDIINNYPQLNVTGMAVGTIDDIQLSVAVFFSKSGYPFITHSDIEGDESAEDELVMGDFKDLFKSYTKTKKETDPHSDIKVTYSVKHKYLFMKEWENV